MIKVNQSCDHKVTVVGLCFRRLLNTVVAQLNENIVVTLTIVIVK